MSIRYLNSNTLHFTAMIALAVIVFGGHAQAAGVTVSNGWIRKLPANLPAAGYFELHNGGDKAVSLTGANSPACGMLMLHQSKDIGGMEHMSDVASVDVAAGKTVTFAPGGYHLMCMHPGPALQIGAKVPVTLNFRGGTKVVADFAVRNAGGK
ncbi:MAG: copper chaperone PCu(A)C [Alphaproteobacteria bacterium]|nr:copper chaperone PCu(A)C [Alphaproteobacteria bacterium]MDE2112048.1 copper chaperone PCu(A)C [Alphaproteobacteria bacterium]MDE2492432.1 copper chaperone PCu(A)C [Alphaproteobacteria bacterium]